jgi:hypothetical protein
MRKLIENPLLVAQTVKEVVLKKENVLSIIVGNRMTKTLFNSTTWQTDKSRPIRQPPGKSLSEPLARTVPRSQVL